MLPFDHQLSCSTIGYHQLSIILSLFKFFVIVDDSLPRLTSRLIVHGSFWSADFPEHRQARLKMAAEMFLARLSCSFRYSCLYLWWWSWQGKYWRQMYRSIPKPPMPPPPRANPRAFDFFEKFWSNSPLCCQFRRSNAPPVRASKRVKSPTLQACEANCANKFCKIFSHYEFLVQLVFAPHFKQRHIPR